MEENNSLIGLDSTINCMSSSEKQWIGSNISNDEKISKNLSLKDLLESDLYHNLAHNIVREIKIKYQSEEMSSNSSSKLSSKELVKNVLRFSTRKMRKSYSKEVKQMSEMVLISFQLFNV